MASACSLDVTTERGAKGDNGMEAVVEIFATREDAEHAAGTLEQAGVEPSRINVLHFWSQRRGVERHAAHPRPGNGHGVGGGGCGGAGWGRCRGRQGVR